MVGKEKEREYRRHTGFIKNSEMNKVSFELYAFSHSREFLEKACSLSRSSQDVNKLKARIVSVSTTDFDTRDTIQIIINTLQGLYARLTTQMIKTIHFTLDIKIIVTDGDETSIPGITFPANLITFASDFEIQTRFHLHVKSSTVKGHMHSGSYFYIMSDSEIDVAELNRVSGIQPSIVYRKGCMGRYTVVAFNSWGIEFDLDNQTPDIPAKELMQRMQKAKEVGIYCKNNNLSSHVDLTCYSIPSNPTHFQLEPSFFSFLKDLSVDYIDFDCMT